MKKYYKKSNRSKKGRSEEKRWEVEGKSRREKKYMKD